MKLAQDLEVDGKLYKKGDKCPESEVSRLLQHNREYLDLKYEDGLPLLNDDEQKKYEFNTAEIKAKSKKEMKIKVRAYSQDSLLEKLNKLGDAGFKEWAKGLYPNLVKKTSKGMIIEILKIQEEERR